MISVRITTVLNTMVNIGYGKCRNSNHVFFVCLLSKTMVNFRKVLGNKTETWKHIWHHL